MTSTTHRKSVNVFGDVITIHWDGNVWVSPSNGQQHSRAAAAMRHELEHYYRACGEDVTAPQIVDEIDGYLSQMADED